MTSLKEAVTQRMLKKELRMPERLPELERMFADAIQKLEEIKTQTIQEVLAYAESLRGPRGEKGDAGKDGVSKDGRDGRDGKDSLVPGPKGEKGDPGSPDKPLEIAIKLNTLTEKVEVSVIKGLSRQLETLAKAVRAKPQTTVKKGGGGNIVQYYDLSALLDGSTKTFALPTHRKVIQVVSSSTPFVFRPVVDYSRTRTSITFDALIDAPSMLASGQSLVVIYAN